MSILNIANIVTFIRLLVGFVLIYETIVFDKVLVVFLYLVFLGLDVLDGFLARKFNCESVFGKNFDLVVDGFIGFLFSFVLVVIGIIDLLFVYLVIPAIVLLFVALVLGFKKMKKKTFAPAKWRKINGAVFFVIPLLFVLGIGWVSYLLLIYVYVSRIVHLRELLV